MKPLLILAAGVLAGCTAAGPQGGPDFTPSHSRLVAPNNAPRGSEEFCRNYGQQTSTNRAFAAAPDGRGPRGNDRALARLEGERAYQRCLSGRTN